MLKLNKLSKVFSELRIDEKLILPFQGVLDQKIDLIVEINLHFL